MSRDVIASICLLPAILTLGGCNGGIQSKGHVGQRLEADQQDLDLFEEYEHSSEVADPFECLNRVIFGLNDEFYNGLMWPISRTYCRIIPRPVRQGIRNFFHNANSPARFVSSLLQSRFDEAGMEFGRFMVNSTVGILGLTDVAGERLGLVIDEDEDMGQALAAFGLGHGPYIVLPLLGPSSLRDAAGELVDWLMNPLRYIDPWEVYAGLTTIRTVNGFPEEFDRYQQITRPAVEPYTAVRQSYIQHRKARLSR